MMRRSSIAPVLLLTAFALLACKKSSSSSSSSGSTGTTGASTATPTTPTQEPSEDIGKTITDLDLAKACNELPTKGSKAYDSATGRIHPTIVFSRKNDNDKFTKSYDSDFDGWKAEAAKDYELVACVTTKSSTKAKECKFDSKTPVHYLDLEDASYEMVVYEAATGKQVGKKSVDLKVDKDCPMIWMFKSERDVKQAEFTQALMGWAKQYVAPKPGEAPADDKAATTEKKTDSKTSAATEKKADATATKSDPKATAKSDPKATTKTEPPKPTTKTEPPKPTTKTEPPKPTTTKK
ncbi:MAG: hypothetical protein U0263_37460 [Polyangiaceae bacterium]